MLPIDWTQLVLVYYLVWIGVLIQAARVFRRYLAIRRVHASVDSDREPGAEVTVEGPVSLREPAVPKREPPNDFDGNEKPALLAWRVRKKVGSGGKRGGSRWTTADGGLAVGEFEIQQDAQRIRIDGDDLLSDHDGVSDPFDVSGIHLGEPEATIRLGDPNPLQGFLERIGLFGEDGLLPDWKISASVGGKTYAPDRYEATAIGHGDEVAIRGILTETREGLELRGDGSEDPTVVGGNLAKRRRALRNEVFELLGIAVVMLVALDLVDRFW